MQNKIFKYTQTPALSQSLSIYNTNFLLFQGFTEQMKTQKKKIYKKDQILPGATFTKPTHPHQYHPTFLFFTSGFPFLPLSLLFDFLSHSSPSDVGVYASTAFLPFLSQVLLQSLSRFRYLLYLRCICVSDSYILFFRVNNWKILVSNLWV